MLQTTARRTATYVIDGVEVADRRRGCGFFAIIMAKITVTHDCRP
jgi:hypothetical protein